MADRPPSPSSRDERLALLKEARRRIRAIEVKDEHAYILGLAIAALYVMRDEIRSEPSSSQEPSK